MLNQKKSLAQVTEVDLCRRGFMAYDHFISSNIRSIYSRIIEDTIKNCKDVPLALEKSFYTDNTSQQKYIGLIDIIVNTYYHKSTDIRLDNPTVASQTVEVTQPYKDTIVYKPLNSFNNQGSKKRALLIEGTEKTRILIEAYALQYEYLKFMHQSVRLGNKPIVQFDSLRVADGSAKNRKQITKSVEDSLQSISRDKGFGILDAKDTLSFTVTSVKDYEELKLYSYEMITSTLGVPLSFISGYIAGTLNTTGEGDRIMLENTLSSFYQNRLSPIFRRILEISNIENTIKYINPTEEVKNARQGQF